jgi:hypothetical protein
MQNFRFTRSISYLFINRLIEFTLRLGSSDIQCFGTSKTDLDRDIKSILLLTSCSNGVHWTIIDRFRISDILAPNFGFNFNFFFFLLLYEFNLFNRTISRILFEKKLNNDNCMIEWRQMIHGGDNQDVWAIDDITIRDVISTKLIKKNLHVKNFQTKLIYIRPGYILSFQLESKTLFDLNDVNYEFYFIYI